MKKALYIDFDGTLTMDRYWRSTEPELHEKIQTLLFGDDTTMVHDWMRGEYTAEEINKHVADVFGEPYEKLWELFVSDCEDMRVNQEMLKLIKTLSGQYTTVLITGNMDSFTRFTIPALQLDQYFDHISNSFYEQMHKTDDNGRLFKDWESRIDISLKESVLIDDHPNCCKMFGELGGDARQTESPEHTFEILKSLI